MMKTAKLFWSGRSQAVRLPKEFRFDGDQVRIRRHGDQIILEPIAKDWTWLDALVGPVDEDFARAVNEQPNQQQRPELDELFP
jgi:antitoxin VapB